MTTVCIASIRLISQRDVPRGSVRQKYRNLLCISCLIRSGTLCTGLLYFVVKSNLLSISSLRLWVRAGPRKGGRSLTKPDRSRGLTMRNQVAPPPLPSRRHQIIGSVLRKKMRHAAFPPRHYSPSFY